MPKHLIKFWESIFRLEISLISSRQLNLAAWQHLRPSDLNSVFSQLSSCVRNRANSRMWPGHRRTHSHVHPKEQMSPATDLIVLCHSDWRPRKFVAPPVSILLGETFMPCMTIFQGVFQGCSIHTHTHTQRRTHPLPRKFHAICYVLCEGL